MRRLVCISVVGVMVVALSLFAVAPTLAGEERNLFEWSAVSRNVVDAEVEALDGPYVELRIKRTLRGSLEPDSIVVIPLKRANRSRNASLEKPLRVAAGERYVWLLSAEPVGTRGKYDVYSLMRGVRGARPIPLEGEAGFIAALEAFIGIHELNSYDQSWQRFREMLTAQNPILIETALAQFIKFDAAEPDVLSEVRALFNHPRPDLRAQAARLTGQVLERWSLEEIADIDVLRAELVARARRDDSIDVRIAATESLSAFEDDGIVVVLEEISEDDADRRVRYAAERLLYLKRVDRTDVSR